MGRRRQWIDYGVGEASNQVLRRYRYALSVPECRCERWERRNFLGLVELDDAIPGDKAEAGEARALELLRAGPCSVVLLSNCTETVRRVHGRVVLTISEPPGSA
jgi:hypothetical protein